MQREVGNRLIVLEIFEGTDLMDLQSMLQRYEGRLVIFKVINSFVFIKNFKYFIWLKQFIPFISGGWY